MIYFRLKSHISSYSDNRNLNQWDELGNSGQYITPREFNVFDFQIDGITFIEWDEDFAKALAWEKLKR